MDQASEKETRIATALKGLTQKELDGYRYFLKHNQDALSPEKADVLFQAYLQGHDCEQIRRMSKVFTYGQVVACKLMYDWDVRKVDHRAELEKNVPVRAAQTHLEAVDFIADLLTVSQMSAKQKMQEYLVTGNAELLKEIPLPKNVKDFQSLFELFLKATGQEKKRIEVTGTVRVDNGKPTGPVSAEEAAEIMNRLLPEATST